MCAKYSCKFHDCKHCQKQTSALGVYDATNVYEALGVYDATNAEELQKV